MSETSVSLENEQELAPEQTVIVIEEPRTLTTDEAREQYKEAIARNRDRYDMVRKIVNGTTEKKYVVSVNGRTETFDSKKELRAGLNDEEMFSHEEIEALHVEFKHVKLPKRKKPAKSAKESSKKTAQKSNK